MFHYLVLVRLIDGSELQGTAETLEIDGQKNEILVLKHPSSSEPHKHESLAIPTVNIAEMHVLTANARFKSVQFK